MNEAQDTYTRANSKGRKAFARKNELKISPNVYPTNPADRRRLNSAVNEKHVRYGWQAGECDR